MLGASWQVGFGVSQPMSRQPPSSAAVGAAVGNAVSALWQVKRGVCGVLPGPVPPCVQEPGSRKLLELALCANTWVRHIEYGSRPVCF